MFQKNIVSVLVAVGALTSTVFFSPANAASALNCAAPEIKVTSKDDKPLSAYTVVCSLPAAGTSQPTVTFTGEIPAGATSPYIIKSHYTVDTRETTARKLNVPARADQQAKGVLHSSALSLASLSMQFDSQTSWDEASKVISIEERVGVWRIHALVPRVDPSEATLASSLNDNETLYSSADTVLVASGFASEPVIKSRTTFKVVLGSKYSRFSGKLADTPVIVASLGLREGKLEFLLGESRVANHVDVQNALGLLDRKPSDMSRAWGLASRAQLLGLTDEVAYAEQKVAAHNPQLVLEFQEGVKRIQPYVLNN